MDDRYACVALIKTFTYSSLLSPIFYSIPFFFSGVSKIEENFWNIPIAYTDAKTGAKRHASNLSTSKMSWDEFKNPGLKINSHTSAFYRVQYSSKQYEHLGPLIPSLSDTDRIGIISDTFALSAAGSLATVEALKLVKNAFTGDHSYPVWYV